VLHGDTVSTGTLLRDEDVEVVRPGAVIIHVRQSHWSVTSHSLSYRDPCMQKKVSGGKRRSLAQGAIDS
jgi:hypothetical protein